MAVETSGYVHMSRRAALLALAGVPVFLAACGSSTSGNAEQGDGAARVVVMDSVPGSGEPAVALSPLGTRFADGRIASVRLIGDSITAGYGCDGYGETTDVVIYDGPYGLFFESAPSVACWANDFRAYAEAHGVTRFVNAGISGAKLRWLAEDPDAWIGDGADLIFVMLGTNDAAYNTADEIAGFGREAFAAVSARCSTMVVLLPLPNDRGDAQNKVNMEEVDQALAKVCDEAGYAYFSLIDALDMSDRELSADRLHPSSKGSHLVWGYIQEGLGLG